MRIAMIISTAFPPEEGIGYYTYNLSKKLIEKWHEITVITRGSLKTKIDFFEGIRVIKAQFIPSYPFHIGIHGFFVNKIFKLIESEFDLLHFHTPLTPFIRTSLPVVTTIHGSMIGNAKDLRMIDFKSIGIKFYTKYFSYNNISKLIEHSNVITTVSESVKNELAEYYSLKNVLITENGVDNLKFIPSDKNEGYVLYVGRLSYGKGLFELLDTVKQINNPNIKFFIVGSGELEKKIKSKIIKENLETKVKLLGRLKHKKLVEIYQKASIFLFLSYYEGCPTVVLEAMSTGLPVIVSDIEAHKNLIKDGQNGFLIKNGSSKEAAKKINILYNDPNLREIIGKNSRKTIEQKFTWDIISQKFDSIYENLLKKGDKFWK